MIDVQQLRALVELSRLGTVSAAAESLGFSQSTVSHQLAALSRATGAVLLTRAGRGVRLTEEGRALAARGQEILDLLDRTEREAISMARAEAGRVRLAAFPSAVASLVPGVLDVVGRQHPGLEVELVDAEPPEALDALRRGRVDAALSFSYVDDDADEGLQAVHLLDDVLYLVSHPGGITRVADGARCRWVTGCARCREELIAVGRANGFAPETAYASDDYVAVQALVAAGVGAALLPGMALSAYRHEGVQVRPLTREHRRVEVVTRAERPRPLAVDVLVEACRT
ncbi:LysR family transcriptional regulator, partial [Actinomyces sp. oral taxon 849]|uniref:LysR family transcriptional regulator n=1 Tax=Actinomyces sp. oral taxon 849 TaxID=653385 RepID=UPI000677E1FE